MSYFLLKSEPDVWSIDQQKKTGIKGAPWDGVRNYQAAKNLKSMKKGDLCFFYHSNIGKEIVGIVEVIKEKNRYKITNLIEKPKLSDAPSRIGILGRYILHPNIFNHISDNVENDKEINLTEALLKASKEAEISGEILEGYHFDTGNIEGLIKASSFFLKNHKILEKKL